MIKILKILLIFISLITLAHSAHSSAYICYGCYRSEKWYLGRNFIASYQQDSIYFACNLKSGQSDIIVITKLEYEENTIEKSTGYKIDGDNVTFQCITSSDSDNSIYIAGLRSSGQSVIFKIFPDSLGINESYLLDSNSSTITSCRAIDSLKLTIYGGYEIPSSGSKSKPLAVIQNTTNINQIRFTSGSSSETIQINTVGADENYTVFIGSTNQNDGSKIGTTDALVYQFETQSLLGLSSALPNKILRVGNASSSYSKFLGNLANLDIGEFIALILFGSQSSTITLQYS